LIRTKGVAPTLGGNVKTAVGEIESGAQSRTAKALSHVINRVAKPFAR
jgi:hypothetical protein